MLNAIISAIPAMATSFLSVVVGALPFLLAAALVSAVLEAFVSNETIARLVPKSRVVGVLVAPLLGFFVPMCDCGIVPVARRMIQKGIPPSTAISFMLANPILNPLVIYATYLAFPFAHQMLYLRLLLGYGIAVVIGLIVLAYNRLRGEQILYEGHLVQAACDCGHDHAHEHAHAHDCAHDHTHDHDVACCHAHDQGAPAQTKLGRIRAMLDHAAAEFFDVMKYFLVGAAIATVCQQLIRRELLDSIGGGMISSVLVMILFAYLICTCSEADAFVAAAFASTFTPGALLAFLVAGPMTDLKNTIMMLAAFRRPFVIFLNVLIFALTAGVTIGINFWLTAGHG